MGCAATAKLGGEAVSAGVAANDNAVPAGRVAWYRSYHRYYDPASGRYTQTEPMLTDPRVAGVLPVQLAQGGRPPLQPYAYAANDPMFYVDLDGQVFQGRGGGVGGPGMVAAGDPASGAAMLAAGALFSGLMYLVTPKCKPKDPVPIKTCVVFCSVDGLVIGPFKTPVISTLQCTAFREMQEAALNGLFPGAKVSCLSGN